MHARIKLFAILFSFCYSEPYPHVINTHFEPPFIEAKTQFIVKQLLHAYIDCYHQILYNVLCIKQK